MITEYSAFSLESELFETNIAIESQNRFFLYIYTLFFVIPILLLTVKVII